MKICHLITKETQLKTRFYLSERRVNNASEVVQIQYLSNSRALWSSPRLGIGSTTSFCMFQKKYVSDLEKKIGSSANRREGVSPLTANTC